jgi:hypothetical protein
MGQPETPRGGRGPALGPAGGIGVSSLVRRCARACIMRTLHIGSRLRGILEMTVAISRRATGIRQNRVTAGFVNSRR